MKAKKTISFILLDYMTVKPYFTARNLLLYALIAVFVTTVSGNIASGMGVGMMLGTMLIGYPFALGEKCNMDALYPTLSINRKSVVLGRYLYTLTLNICAVLVCVAIAAAGIYLAKLLNFAVSGESPTAIVIVLSAMFIFIQSIQLPIYFKYGYSKAKIFSLIPMGAIMICYIVIISMGNAGGWLSAFLIFVFDGAAFGYVATAAMLAIAVVSYKMSVRFYMKREF